jgi:hypothetical protein
MKTKRMAVLWAAVACVGLMITDAGAQIILFSDYGVGTISPGVIPSDDTYLVNMINTYNSGASATIGSQTYTIYQGSQTPNAPLPLPLSLGPEFADGGPNINVNLGNSGYTYIFANIYGPGLDVNAIYDVEGLTGTFALSTYGVPGVNSGSVLGEEIWLSTATPVPEPTTLVSGALLLLSFGSSAVRQLRKKLQAA